MCWIFLLLMLYVAVCNTVVCCILYRINKAQDKLAREQFRLGNRIGLSNQSQCLKVTTTRRQYV